MLVQIKVLNKEFYKEIDVKPEFKDSLYGAVKHGNYPWLPSYATLGSAGLDLRCTEDVTIYPGETKFIPTGLAIWIGSSTGSDPLRKAISSYLGGHADVAGIILPRSGLATNQGLVLANTVGLIDEDYQGELKIAAWNRNKFIFTDSGQALDYYGADLVINIKSGQKIAQLVFMPVVKAQWEVVEEFSATTERGGGGFGSTGE